MLTGGFRFVDLELMTAPFGSSAGFARAAIDAQRREFLGAPDVVDWNDPVCIVRAEECIVGLL